MDNLNLYLKLQKPIPFYDVCFIYQPTINDIFDKQMGQEKFNQLLLPYGITTDMLDNIPDEAKKQITNFDIVTRFKDIVPYLLKSLKYFTRSNLSFDKNGIFFEGFSGRLNQDNWDEFAEIILKICARERPKKEIIPTFANERQKDIWTKLQEGRKRAAKHNELKLEDVINICHLGGDYLISKAEINSYTLWEVLNVYKSKMGMSNYKDSFNIYLVSGEKSLIENKHWSELIKIDYQVKE